MVAPDTIELRELPRPEPGPDRLLVDVELCGVCGTDRKYLDGGVRHGSLPMILGHEIVGIVREAGERAAQHHGLAPGDRIVVESSIPCWSCSWCRRGAYRLCPTKGGYGIRWGTDRGSGLWGGMAETIEVAPGSIVHRLDPDITPPVAIGLEILGNSYQWLLRQGGLRAGQRVLILGCGPQGLCATLVASAAHAGEIVVTGLERDAARLAFAAAQGARTVVVDPEWDAATRLAALGADFDVVLDVTGDPRSLAGAIDHVRPQGTFVLASVIGADVQVPFRTDTLAYREIRIQGVLSKDDEAVTGATALARTDPALREALGRLITHVFPLEAARDAVLARDAGLPGFVKAAIRPSDVAGSAA
jgi:2-desacetyl-2-hydroxyethyl bacteriochlorophyllide A dehydrogenase